MYGDNVPLQIPSNMLKMPEIKNKDILEQKYQYDKIGANATIIIEPAVIKFSGFEVNKLNILKVKVLNKSTVPQRVYILPPQSHFFSVKFDKKGLLASGMAEDLYIHFKPNEYKYYYDAIKINSENDTLLIPIHAYPALNRDNIREVFPRLIDFGITEIGQTQTFVQIYPLQCKIPLNFEFEFNFLKDHSDIKISPSKGIIPGKGTIDIEISYTPSTNFTIVAEVELKISQFDFEPLLIKIMGSGRGVGGQKGETKRPQSQNNKLKSLSEKPQQLPTKEYIFFFKEIYSHLEEENSLPGETTPKTEGMVAPNEQVKTLIKSVNSKNQQSLKKSLAQERDASLSDPKQLLTTIPAQEKSKLPTVQRQQLEKNYLDHFNQVFQLDKDKDIRFFQCVGDLPISVEIISSIKSERVDYKNKKLKDMEKQGITRYGLQQDNDCAIVDEILPKYECSWDFDKNDTIKIKRIVKDLIYLTIIKKLKKFVFAVTRVYYSLLFGDRLKNIQAFLKGVKDRQVVKKMVNQDWQKAEYAGVGKKDFIQFNFEFEENNLGKFFLPVQYSSSNNFSTFRFDINPRTGFDDWSQIEAIPYCDQEVMQYQKWDYPQLVFHPPLIEQLNFRTGAEEEMALRGKMGPAEDQLIKIDYEDRIREIMNKPPEQGCVKQTLKCMQQYEPMNPIEPFYYLTFNKVKCIGADLDPDITMDQTVLKQEFINRTPGYEAITLLHELNLEEAYYQERNMQLAYDYAYETENEKYCPPLLAKKEYDDHLTDDDSDGEGPPQLNVIDVNDFLKKIEQEDKNILSIKEKNQNEIFDRQLELKRMINENLGGEKDKWVATVPSKTNDYNKFTSLNSNKMVIL